MHPGQQLAAVLPGEADDLVVAKMHGHHVLPAGAPVLLYLGQPVLKAGPPAPEGLEAFLRKNIRHQVKLLVINAPEVAALGRQNRRDLLQLGLRIGQTGVLDDAPGQLLYVFIRVKGQGACLPVCHIFIMIP